MLRKFGLNKVSKQTGLEQAAVGGTTVEPIMVQQYQMPTSTRIKLTFYIAFMSIMMFFFGIALTLNLQQHVVTGPLEIIQRPILAMSHIPFEAHKQWLDLNDAIMDVDRYFYDREKINYTKMYYAAAQSALQTLNDAYTRFEEPQTATAMNDFLNGHGGAGLGVETRFLQGKFTFVDVYPNNPADKAGLKTNDILLKIDGKDIPNTGDAGKDLKQAADTLQGEVNTKVTLTIQRPSDNDRVMDITITRSYIQRPLIETKLLPNNIGYVKIKESFGDKTGEEFNTQVQQLVNQGATKFVLDVRGNGGGLVEAARSLLGHFLSNGTAYYEKVWNGQQLVQNETAVRSTDKLQLYNAPLVVLVDKGSASASEIMAGALQGRGRATLIGEQTYGKGVAQYVVPLEDGAAARITYAHWLTPAKLDINHNGLTPDVKVSMDPADEEAGRDTQLDRAVQFLQNGQKAP